MDKLGINLGFLIFQILNFTVLIVLMYAFAYRPILKMLDDRKKKIAQGLEDARVAAEARANAEKEARDITAKAQADANQKIREATDRAEVAAKEIMTSAEADAAKAREASLAEAALERDRVLADVRGQIGALAKAAAQRLIGEALDEGADGGFEVDGAAEGLGERGHAQALGRLPRPGDGGQEGLILLEKH